MSDEILKKQCEEYVRSRQSRLADKAIVEYLKFHRRSVESRLQAGEWYRRLGEYSKAYMTVAPSEYSVRRANEDVRVSRQYLRAAFLLNLMGAAQSALRIVNQLKTFEDSEDNRLLGFLYLSNFEYKKALQHFLLMEKNDPQPDSYSSRVGRIGTCDAIASIGEHQKALKKLATIQARPEETLLQGILIQVRGEYLCKTKAWNEAWDALSEAEKFFPPGDQSYDRVILLKWQAVTLANLGKKARAKKILRDLFEVQKNPQNRPEMWLEVLRWMNEFGFLTEGERQLLWSYPGVPEMIAKEYGPPPSLTIGPPDAKIWLSTLRDEYRVDGVHASMMPKQLELLELLVRSGENGLSVHRACSILWPNEIGNFVLLEDRLQKLQRRLRQKYKMRVYSEDKVIRLGTSHFSEISVEVIAPNRLPSIFLQKQEVTAKDVQDFYRLAKTQSFKLLNVWSEKSLVKGVTRGRVTYYLPLTSASVQK